MFGLWEKKKQFENTDNLCPFFSWGDCGAHTYAKDGLLQKRSTSLYRFEIWMDVKQH